MNTPSLSPQSLAELVRSGLLADGLVTAHEYRAIGMKVEQEVVPGLCQRMAAPLADIEQQTLYLCADRGRQQLTIHNFLRGRRSAAPGPYTPPPYPADFAAGGVWSAAHPNPQIREPFGVIRGDRDRVLVRANIARSGIASAIVFRADQPDHLALTPAEYVALAEASWAYMRAAHRYDPSLKYWVMFHNGGRRSAGSLDWCHLQIVGLPVPFGLSSRLACVGPPDYLAQFLRAHESAGLVVPVASDFLAVADLAPAKEAGVVAISDTLADGAKYMRQMINHLITHRHLQSYSVAAFVNPSLFGAAPLLDLPPVWWSFVDRGPAGSTVGDFGSLEALAGTAVVASDPYDVARSLRSAFAM